MRVLLVEDDPTTSKSIEMMLTHANLNVYTTDMGEDASAFWAAFTAAMRASGVNDASLLLAGCLPDDWEIAEIERTNARTAATREENA